MSKKKRETVTVASVREKSISLAFLDSINKPFGYKKGPAIPNELIEKDQEFDFIFFSAFLKARRFYGNYGVDIKKFRNHFSSIIEKNHNSERCRNRILQLIESYYINDLYLAYACSLGIDSAWECFVNTFTSDIKSFAKFFAGNSTTAEEIASSIWSYLYLPSRSGHRRISTYDGRIPLTNWLRVVISNQLINYRELKSNRIECLDDVTESSISSSALFEYERVDSAIRFKQYGVFISNSLRESCRELTNQECLLILLRYERGLKLENISRLFNVHQSTIMRRLEKICRKIRRKVKTDLLKKYKLNEIVMKECLADLLKNQSYSIINEIRESRDETTLQRLICSVNNAKLKFNGGENKLTESG